jgi:hypothetical protein
MGGVSRQEVTHGWYKSSVTEPSDHSPARAVRATSDGDVRAVHIGVLTPDVMVTNLLLQK